MSSPPPPPRTRRILRAQPEKRSAALRTEPFDPVPPPGGAVVQNLFGLIHPGHDLGLLAAAESGGREFSLGRLALGRIVAASDQPGGPAPGSLVLWSGPLADWARLDPAIHAWTPAPEGEPDPAWLLAGIAAEAAHGIRPLSEAPAGAPRSAAVLGQGMLGHWAALLLKEAGWEVTVVENSPKRLEFSKYAGLRRKIDTHNLDWRERLDRWNPEGLDAVVEATGQPAPCAELLRRLRPGGWFAMLGPWRPELPSAEAVPEVAREIRRAGANVAGPAPSFGDAPEHGRPLEEYAGRIARGDFDVRRLLTNRTSPSGAAMDVKRLATGVKSMLGVVLDWTAEPGG